jgi:hypothetical protein
MDAKLKADWVAALRSGKYEQTFATFESRGAVCALGLLCKVAGQPTASQMPGCETSGNWEFVHNRLTFELAETIYRMNDSRAPFRKIAAWIEANVPTDGPTTDITIFRNMLSAPLAQSEDHQSEDSTREKVVVP